MLPEGDPLLLSIAEKFASVGLSEQVPNPLTLSARPPALSSSLHRSGSKLRAALRAKPHRPCAPASSDCLAGCMRRTCAQAVPAYLKAGDVKSAIDCCVLLNQWDKAVGLAEQHRFPQANRRAAPSHPCPFLPILPGPILPIQPPAPPCVAVPSLSPREAVR
jgi:hypothetical protein